MTALRADPPRAASLLLARIRYGAHLFGTERASSDLDEKSIVVPDARTLLLGEATTAAIAAIRGAGRAAGPAQRRRKAPAERDATDIPLTRFLLLAAEGQTTETDLLFAPEAFHLDPPHPLWRELMANRSRLLSRQVAGFVGLCRNQADAYGTRVERLEAAEETLRFLEALAARGDANRPLGTFADEVRRWAEGRAHIGITDRMNGHGRVIPHLEICERATPFTSSLGLARDIARATVRRYGHRTRAAALDGMAWKAISHATRVGYEALELLEHGTLTFPRPEAARLLALKLGEVTIGEAVEELKALIARVEAAREASNLPETPDYDFIEDFVLQAHRAAIDGKL